MSISGADARSSADEQDLGNDSSTPSSTSSLISKASPRPQQDVQNHQEVIVRQSNLNRSGTFYKEEDEEEEDDDDQVPEIPPLRPFQSLHSLNSSRSTVGGSTSSIRDDRSDTAFVPKPLFKQVSFTQNIGLHDEEKADPSAFKRPTRVNSFSPPADSALIGWWRRQQRWWPVEIANWFMSVILFFINIALLAGFQNRQEPDFGFGTSINTIVSVFATLLTISLMVPVTSALGQTKWLWFRRQRPLTDFQLIEEATSGPIKAFVLLINRRGGVLAVSGALLTLLILGVNPFFQQVVSHQNVDVAVGLSSIPITVNYRPVDQLRKNPFQDPALAGALYRGLYAQANSSIGVTATCAAQKCVWPVYSTLAMCSECKNVTVKKTFHTLSDGTKSTTLTAPNGFSLTTRFLAEDGSLQEASFNMTGLGYGPDFSFESMHYNGTGFPVVDFVAIRSEEHAFECRMNLCVKSYTTVENTANRSTNNSLVGTWSNNTVHAIPLKIHGNASCSSAPAILHPPGQNKTFFVDECTYGRLRLGISSFFTGNVTKAAGASDWNFSPPQSVALFRGTGSYVRGHNLASIMDNVATLMSARMRGRGNTNESAYGTAYNTEYTVTVDWPWVTLPAAAIVLTLIYLIAVMIASRAEGVEPWKSNTIATLFHGPPKTGPIKIAALGKIDGMENMADLLNAKMVESDDGWVLMPEMIQKKATHK